MGFRTFLLVSIPAPGALLQKKLKDPPKQRVTPEKHALCHRCTRCRQPVCNSNTVVTDLSTRRWVWLLNPGSWFAWSMITTHFVKRTTSGALCILALEHNLYFIKSQKHFWTSLSALWFHSNAWGCTLQTYLRTLLAVRWSCNLGCHLRSPFWRWDLWNSKNYKNILHWQQPFWDWSPDASLHLQIHVNCHNWAPENAHECVLVTSGTIFRNKS